MVAVIGIRPEKLAYHKELHAAAWPGFLDRLSKSNIRNFSIYPKEPENLLFSNFEYDGNDYATDSAAFASDPMTQEWWTKTDPCQAPLEPRKTGEWWASMEEVFHQD
jgi:L-rhamnose mutarotase